MLTTDPSSSPSDPAARWVRLLVAHPELAGDVAGADLEEAQRVVVAPLTELGPGAWDGTCPGVDPFGAVVLDGLMARECFLAGRVARHIVGSGDVIGLEPTAGDGEGVGTLRWCVETPTRLAILDRRFVAAVARWPWMVASVVRRTTLWADRASVLHAIGLLPRVEDRILALLWHLADRWGRVAPGAVVLPLRLSHAALGSLVGARRPTVSIALALLQRRGAVTRRGQEWLLDPHSRTALDVGDGREQEARHGTIAELPRGGSSRR